jgi:hypothetical protein
MLKALDIQNAIKILPYKYYKLILVVGPKDRQISGILKKMSLEFGYDYINLNLKLSERLIRIPFDERCFYVEGYVNEIIESYRGSLLILDNIEILFEKHLKVDPLFLLKNLSRYKAIIAHWNGKAEDGHLIYAVPQHPDFAKYRMDEHDYIVINTVQEKQGNID